MQVWDKVQSELIHNKTYAHRLPPTFIEQARGFADFRENAIFSDSAMGGIGNSECAPAPVMERVLTPARRYSRQPHRA